MLHLDVPTHAELTRLLDARSAASVSVYLPTTPITADVGASRIELKNLAAQARTQLDAAGTPAADVAGIVEALDDLIDDDDFWAYQAHSLAIFATPSSVVAFRLANRLGSRVEVSDRFFVKPLLRAATFPPAAYVLALAQGSARLFEVAPDVPVDELRVEGMPRDAASAVGKASIGDRSPSGRIQGSEGQKVRLAQYARAVDPAIRPIVASGDLPLILAATEPLASIFRGVTSAPGLLADGIPGNPEGRAAGELAAAARSILDGHHAAALGSVRDRYAALAPAGRAVSDLPAVARAAVHGAVDTLLVDIDADVPGTLDAVTGEVSLDAARSVTAHGITDELVRHTWAAGGRVLAVRAEDIPDGRAAAAILRYAI